MSGIDINRFVDLDPKLKEPLICVICFNIFDNPVNSKCRHTFCRSCIQQWIDTNHSDCPKCKQQLGRKRRNEDNDSILIGDYVFGRDFTANEMISRLNIKCSFEYNGCQEVIEFGLLESHLKNCEHNKCKSCSLRAQPMTPHNCLEVLQKELFSLKQKLETNGQFFREFKDIYFKINSIKVSENGELERIRQLVDVCLVFELLFGSYCCSSKAIELTLEGIKVMNIPSNNPKCKFKYHIMIPFREMEEILYCSDQLYPTLKIKPNIESCFIIKDCLHLGTNSTNCHTFDVNSKDVSQRYITMSLRRECLSFINRLFVICKIINPQTICQGIDPKITQEFIENVAKDVKASNESAFSYFFGHKY